MDATDIVMRTAVGLASTGIDMDSARRQLLAVAEGDRTALEVARAIVMRDGLPRHRPPTPSRARPSGSLRNRTLNLLEYAMSETAPVSGATQDGHYAWNEVVFETWG
ncbi:MAG TPA: hypothetical protein VHF25_10515 [Nitriliruptorales bacterium]|nr:hypothetical protein [Nitriliruptorales bacterium]